jgi:hypothetical protein
VGNFACQDDSPCKNYYENDERYASSTDGDTWFKGLKVPKMVIRDNTMPVRSEENTGCWGVLRSFDEVACFTDPGKEWTTLFVFTQDSEENLGK